MAKAREVVSISEISRIFGISRQSVRNWVERHEDFPRPILAEGARFTAGKGAKATLYAVVDTQGRTRFFDLADVKAWVKSHASSLRSQGAAKPAPKKSKGKTTKKGSRAASAAASKPSKGKKAAKMTDAPVRKPKKGKKVVKKGKKAKAAA